MSLFAAIRQRIADHRRERRIRALRVEACRLLDAGDSCGGRAMCELLFHECEQRSPAQNERMERAAFNRLDPHAQAVFERSRRP